jgi:hypothetical protein
MHDHFERRTHLSGVPDRERAFRHQSQRIGTPLRRRRRLAA